MEYNRYKALRAKDIAQRKFSNRDFCGAKTFILMAQELVPSLEGLTAMLHICDVQITALRKIRDSEMDWYGILQVNPGANVSEIRKQYKKLALIIHPDKCFAVGLAVGAEEAFRLIRAAWEVLSDEKKRAQHDWIRNLYPATSITGAPPSPSSDTSDESVNSENDFKEENNLEEESDEDESDEERSDEEESDEEESDEEESDEEESDEEESDEEESDEEESDEDEEDEQEDSDEEESDDEGRRGIKRPRARYW